MSQATAGTGRETESEKESGGKRFQNISSLSLEGVAEMRCGGTDWGWVGCGVRVGAPVSSLTSLVATGDIVS